MDKVEMGFGIDPLGHAVVDFKVAVVGLHARLHGREIGSNDFGRGEAVCNVCGPDSGAGADVEDSCGIGDGGEEELVAEGEDAEMVSLTITNICVSTSAEEEIGGWDDDGIVVLHTLLLRDCFASHHCWVVYFLSPCSGHRGRRCGIGDSLVLTVANIRHLLFMLLSTTVDSGKKKNIPYVGIYMPQLLLKTYDRHDTFSHFRVDTWS